MKKKITISLDENILGKIDKGIKKGKGKNRSAMIENILKERYGGFADTTVIIFAHDNKWDNRLYPFDIPKSLLDVRKKSLIERQLENFSKPGINNFIITIPTGSTGIFKKKLDKYIEYNILYIELDKETMTGKALKAVLKNNETLDNVIISNGDIFYGKLDIEKYYNYHQKQNSDFSFCLKFVMNPEQLGNIAINGNKIVAFLEKPKARSTYLTNSGLYITSYKFLKKHDFGDYLELDFFPKLPDIANTIGYVYQGEWEHIQNDSAYERVNGELI